MPPIDPGLIAILKAEIKKLVDQGKSPEEAKKTVLKAYEYAISLLASRKPNLHRILDEGEIPEVDPNQKPSDN